jgi:predicted glycoside hydrolase/deacetylase ChbG (UPF0249 family)
MKKVSTMLFLFLTTLSFAQEKTLSEKLGYSKEDKLLIIHADDIGLSHSENLATISSMTNGFVNSTSIMMPSAWSTEVGELIKEHPDLDIGVHITLTNEWFNYKWGPLADGVPGLKGPDGFMFPDCALVAKNASPEEVEKEMRAQIEAAIKIGIKPTHMDSHMGCVFYGRPEFLASYLRLAKEYGFPAMVVPQMVESIIKANPELFKDIDVDNLAIIDQVAIASPTEYDEKGMEGFYTDLLNSLTPGITALLIHVAYDNDEMKAVTVRHPYWNSAWRQADYDFFTSEKGRNLIKDNNIKLVTWREIAAVN